MLLAQTSRHRAKVTERERGLRQAPCTSRVEARGSDMGRGSVPLTSPESVRKEQPKVANTPPVWPGLQTPRLPGSPHAQQDAVLTLVCLSMGRSTLQLTQDGRVVCGISAPSPSSGACALTEVGKHASSEDSAATGKGRVRVCAGGGGSAHRLGARFVRARLKPPLVRASLHRRTHPPGAPTNTTYT